MGSRLRAGEQRERERGKERKREGESESESVREKQICENRWR